MSKARVGLRFVSLRLVVLACCLAAIGGREDDWLDPYDMINYDAGTKTMRKAAEPTTYPNVPTKRREHGEDMMDCSNKVSELQREVEEQRRSIESISQQPSCSPVFRRFLTRFLKLINNIGLPADNTDNFYNTKVKITRQGVIEIQRFLESGNSWQHGAMDDALGQMLIDVKPLDYEAWRWRFEDVFGVEIDTVLKVFLSILVATAIICTQLWSAVSWFTQFRRMFALCFFVSLVWNWFYLYKIEFAQHQSRLAKSDAVYEQCTGMRKMDWRDSLTEWYRRTWTLQDDPCQKYYEDLMVNPILLVPPSKAFTVTITTYFTEPLKHIGQGISDFLRALLKDLPITLQLPVLITIVLSILVVMYGGVQAAFQHGIMAPLRLRNPPAPPVVAQVQPPAPPPPSPSWLMMADPQGAGDAPQERWTGRRGGGAVRRRGPTRAVVVVPAAAAAAAAPRQWPVVTLGDVCYSQDEMDVTEPAVQRYVGDPRTEGEGESEEDFQVAFEEEEEEVEEVVMRRQAPPRTVPREAKKQAEAAAKPTDLTPNVPRAKRQDNVRREGGGASTDGQSPAGLSGSAEQSLSAELSPSRFSLEYVETVCSPVQETSPTQ